MARRPWLLVPAFVLVACASGGSGHGDPPPAPIPAAGTVAAEVDLGGAGQGVAVEGGFVWVGLHHAGGVAKVDPATNEIVARIPTGDRPGSLTAGGGAVWVGNYGSGATSVSLSRIEASTGEVTATVAAPDIPDLCCDPALGDGALWVPTGDAGVVVHVRAESGAVAARISVEGGAEGLAYAGGLVWVSDAAGRDAVIRGIDPSSGSISHEVPVGDSATPTATDGELVWGLTVNEVFAIDPGSGELAERIPVDVFQGVLAVGEGAVWVAGKRGKEGVLYRIDPVEGRVVGELTVGQTPSRLAVGLGAVWITDFDAGKLYRVEPA